MLPATLLLAADQLEQPSAAVAAAGLLWLIPAVIVLLVLPRGTTTPGKDVLMTTIEVRHVNLDAPGGRRLLDDVSLSVPSGTQLAICGPAGAGKTALMRVLVGLDDHTEGDVLIDGPSSTPSLRASATSPSSSPTSPSIPTSTSTTTSRSRPVCAVTTRTTIDERVEEVAEFLALEHLLDHSAVRARRQPAPARRHRPVAGARRPRLPVRRAVHGPGRPRPVARPLGHDAVAGRPQAHVDLHHVRRERGPDPGRSRRRHAPGLPAPGRHSARPLRATG